MTRDFLYSTMTFLTDAPLAQLDRALDFGAYRRAPVSPRHSSVFSRLGPPSSGQEVTGERKPGANGILRGWWGNPCGFKSRLRHHVRNKGDSGCFRSPLFRLKKPQMEVLSKFGMNAARISTPDAAASPRAASGRMSCSVYFKPLPPVVMKKKRRGCYRKFIPRCIGNAFNPRNCGAPTARG